LAELLADYTRGADVTLTLCGDRSARRYEKQQRGMLQWARGLFKRPATATALEAL
jgi:hypothetical protein